MESCKVRLEWEMGLLVDGNVLIYESYHSALYEHMTAQVMRSVTWKDKFFSLNCTNAAYTTRTPRGRAFSLASDGVHTPPHCWVLVLSDTISQIDNTCSSACFVLCVVSADHDYVLPC